MSETPLTAEELGQFTGTNHWYRHSFARTVTYTDGVKYLADRAGAYWLIDEIALAQSMQALKAEPFQAWTLKVNLPSHKATLHCTDGNKNGLESKEVYSKTIMFTDFPLHRIELWVVDGGPGQTKVILLPSEY